MLNRVFNVENGFWTFANKVADMVILEILWLVFLHSCRNHRGINGSFLECDDTYGKG